MAEKRMNELKQIAHDSLVWAAKQFYMEELTVNERINLKGNYEWIVVDGDEKPLMSIGGLLDLYAECSEGEVSTLWNELKTPRVFEEMVCYAC